MIIDNLKNANKYYACHDGFKEAFEFLLNADGVEDGSYEIVPGLVNVGISTYTNKPVDECRYESHARMIDIQCVLSGGERIDITDSKKLDITEDNYESGDIAFLENTEDYVSASLVKGDFAVIYPFEAHKPCVAPHGEGVRVRKAVVKIKF